MLIKRNKPSYKQDIFANEPNEEGEDEKEEEQMM